MVLTGLSPGDVYSYRVGDGTAWNWSPRFSFRATRTVGDSSRPVKLLVLCDVGVVGPEQSGAITAAAADIAGGQFDAVHTCGDFGYDLMSEGGRLGDVFMRAMQPMAAKVPWLTTPGNHETSSKPLVNFTHYSARFAMPGASPGSVPPFYWSTDIGTVHVVAYNTEAFFWPALFDAQHIAAQTAWLAADLARADANREAVPWIIVMGHRPMYCTATQADGRCDGEHEVSRAGARGTCSPDDGHTCWLLGQSAGPSIEALFHKHGVDVAFFGHVHSYSRSLPVYDEKVVGGEEGAPYTAPRGTVHFTTGASGNEEMAVGSLPPPLGKCGAPWCAFQAGFRPKPGQSADYSYSRITVTGAKQLRWEQVSATLGAVIDTVEILRPTGRPAFGDGAQR